MTDSIVMMAQFRKFKHSNNIPNSLIDNNILSLGEAPLGNMIIGTTRGLMVYNKATEIFLNIPFGYRTKKHESLYICNIGKKEWGYSDRYFGTWIISVGH